MATAILRNFCWTINNYTLEDFEGVEKLAEICSYLVAGFEKAPTTGTPHLQCYAELTKQTRRTTIMKYIPRGAKVEPRKGNSKQASDYCKKDGDFLEWGVLSKQGERSDLHAIKEFCLTDGMRGVTAISNNMQQIRVCEKFLTYNEPERNWKPEVIWLWGPTGTGKSRRAREICGDDVFCKNTATKWWDGYDAHENVIIDDFRDSWWSITYMLALLDRYSFQVEVKGGQRQMRAKRIVITSAVAPGDCYAGTGEAIGQLLRRLDSVTNVTEVGGVISEGPPDPIDHLLALM